MNLGVKIMSIFGNKKPITINELSEESLRNLRNDIDKEISKRMELSNGTAENIAKKIRELFNLKENKNKFFVYNSKGYVNIIRVSGVSDISAYNGDVTIHSYKAGVEYGTYDKIWERLCNYSNEVYITIFKVDDTTIDTVKECFKTREEVKDIMEKHLDRCCTDFKEYHLDIMKKDWKLNSHI